MEGSAASVVALDELRKHPVHKIKALTASGGHAALTCLGCGFHMEGGYESVVAGWNAHIDRVQNDASAKRVVKTVEGIPPDVHEERASKWQPFVLLRTVIEQSSSSLVPEAMIVLERLQERIETAEALGDA